MGKIMNKTKKILRNKRRQRGGKKQTENPSNIKMKEIPIENDKYNKNIKIFENNNNNKDLFTEIKNKLDYHDSNINKTNVYINLTNNLKNLKDCLIKLLESEKNDDNILIIDVIKKYILDYKEISDDNLKKLDNYENIKKMYYNFKELLIELDTEITEYKTKYNITGGGKKRTKRTRGKKAGKRSKKTAKKMRS